MIEHGVVVAGGGPAGSIAAFRLALAGVPVTVVERARFPRRKVCGEYLSAGTLQLLDGLGLGETVRRHGRALFGIRLVPPLAEPVVLRFPVRALALAREVLDALLLDAAVAAGARVMRAHVTDVVVRDGRAVGLAVRDDDGAVSTLPARFVVGADGVGSLVARRLGLVRRSRGTQRFAVGGHYTGFSNMESLVEMYVGAGGYFAVNPLGEDRANVMVVVREPQLAQWSRDVDEGVRGKAAELGRGYRSFAGTKRVGPRVAVGPLRFAVRRAAMPGALLIGDAAGMLDPFTGQGVFGAVAGGVAVAEAIAGALASPTKEERIVEAFARTRTSELRRRRALCALVATMLDMPLLARRVAAKLARLPEAGDGLMAAISGIAAPESALAPATLARLLL